MQVHASDMRCFSCGHDLSGTPHGPCPECGRDNGLMEAACMHRRRAWLGALWPKRSMRLACVVYVLALGMPVAAGVLFATDVWSTVNGVVAAGFLAVIALSTYLGPRFVRRAWPGHERECAVAMLRSRLWMLHIPWLMFPAALAVQGGVGAYLAYLTRQGSISEWTLVDGCHVAWRGSQAFIGGASSLFFLFWLYDSARLVERLGLRSSWKTAAAFMLCALAVFGASALAAIGLTGWSGELVRERWQLPLLTDW